MDGYTLLVLIGGVLLLILGGSAAARATVLALSGSKLSPLVGWGFLYGFLAALPELSMSLTANLVGMSTLALSVPIGSSIFNMLLVLGLGALIRPVALQRQFTWWPRLSLLLLVPSALAWALVSDFKPHATGQVPPVYGVVLLTVYLLLLLYLALYLQKNSQRQDVGGTETALLRARRPRVVGAFLWGVVGALLLGVGAWCSTWAAARYALATGASQEWLGLLLMAPLGGLPELTGMIALRAKHNDLDLLPNLMSSSAANLLFVIGLNALLMPMPRYQYASADLLVLLIGNGLVMATIYIGRGHRVSRTEGAILLGGYVAYAVFIALRQPLWANMAF